MVADSNVCNFKDLVDEIIEKYHPDHHELVIVAYYDADSKPDPLSIEPLPSSVEHRHLLPPNL